MKILTSLACWALMAVAGALVQGPLALAAPPILPGLQPDGSVLLHNQWPIRPAGRQVDLGDFPLNLAVDPSGRYAAVLHCGHGTHEIRIVDLAAGRSGAPQPIREAFYGLAFSADGRSLVCSGASDGVLHVFGFHAGRLTPGHDVRVIPQDNPGVVAGLALGPDGRSAAVGILFSSEVVRLDLRTGKSIWTTHIEKPGQPPLSAPSPRYTFAPNDETADRRLVDTSNPLSLAWDTRRDRIYASLWGSAAIAVLKADDGRLVECWPAGSHPNEILLSPDGSRLFVSNGGLNTVTVLDAGSGSRLEEIRSSLAATDRPGSTPDSLALSRDGGRLFVANADNNNVAVFDVGTPGKGRSLGFIPAGWFPSSVRLTPDGRTLLVVNARGVRPGSNSRGTAAGFIYIGDLYRGSLGIIRLPGGDAFDGAMSAWTRTAELCRPAPYTIPPDPQNPIPSGRGRGSPIRYVVYVMKENRTYDQVFGDLSEGNGDSRLCLFPEDVTPNLHAIARQFVLLDNFYANAEVSASGHEWSMAGYASEMVEKTWPIEYRHQDSKMPYVGGGRFSAALPEVGYLWDRAKAAGVSYRSFGEFAFGEGTPGDPSTPNLPALAGHVDPLYPGWNLAYSDLDRASRFISELHRFEAAGDMPRLQIVYLPNDHTQGAAPDALTPRAFVAQNDLAVGRVVDALSHSRFWPQTAVFVVEDDAQNGPDHVDAHRTEALVVSPYTRRGAVDSTPYSTCSMLRTIELILGLEPMSQFDAAAAPMAASFQAAADLRPYTATAARIDLGKRNPAGTRTAAISARLDFSHPDAIDDQVFNRVVWAAVRGEDSTLPAPVHAAFVRSLPKGADDDGDDD
jgi:DNA-binding beta-propeller fold protein YncE